MRHLCQVGEDRLARNIPSQDQSETSGMLVIDWGAEKFAQKNGFGSAVRQLDADHVASGHHSNPHRDRAHRSCDVVGEPNDPRGLDPWRWLKLVKRHDWSRTNLYDLTADAEILQHRLEKASVFSQRFFVDLRGLDCLRPCQEFERGQQGLFVWFEVECRLSLLIGTLSGCERLCPGRDKADEPAAVTPLVRDT